jgi:hypothetical protein
MPSMIDPIRFDHWYKKQEEEEEKKSLVSVENVCVTIM